MIQVDRRPSWPLLSIILAVVLTSTAPLVRAQAVAGAQVSGQVTDASGAAVPGAQVAMTQFETHYTRTANTDAQGSYTLPNLPVGPYVLTITTNGFKRFERKDIDLQVGNNVQINAQLDVGAVSESVEVSAGAAMVETKENAVSQVINQQEIVDLPLNGRQATQLILISGAATVSPNLNLISSKNYSSSTTMSIAGGQGNGTNYLLDGGDNNDTFSNVNLPFPFPDALQEFSVETNALPARNGLHPGGVVDVVTKSGTNTLHGDLFAFLRNGDVNARNFFAPIHDTLKRNQYGGTMGDKIIANKLFFFAGFQGTRNRQDPPNSVAFVPTPAAMQGDFSALESGGCVSGKARTITDPTTKAPYPNDQVPVSLFDPAAVKIVSHLPVPTDPCGRVVYAIPSTGDEDQAIGRMDWNIGSNNALFGRYFLADYRNPAISSLNNALLSHTNGNLERSQSMTIGDTHSFSPTTLNTFHSSFTRLANDRVVPDGYNPVGLGINIFNYDPSGMLMSVSGAFSTGASPGVFNRNTFQEADDVDLIRGKHQIAFGVDVIRTQNNLLSAFNRNGNFAFNGQYTNDPMLDFLEGRMSDFQQSRAQVNTYRQTILGFYIQDTWKISPRVLINAGVRWEPMLYPQDYYGNGNSFSMAAFLAGQKTKAYPNAPAGLLFYDDPGIPKAFTNDKYRNFSPRLGLVLNPHGDGHDTIRIGGGMLYDIDEVYYSERLTTNAPYGNSIDLGSAAGPLSNPWLGYPGGNPFPGTYPPSSSVTFPTFAAYSTIPMNLHPTYMMQWNVSYQRQLKGNWLVSASYLGNKTSHLWLSVDINPSLYIPGQSSTSNTNQRRILYLLNSTQGQYYGSVITTDDGANATYNGLLTSVQHRFSHGFTFLANYTWSHCISDGDFTGNVGNEQYQNQSDRRADRGDCNYDIRHIFNSSLVMITPGVGRGFINKLARNWQIAPLVRIASGLPFIVGTGKDDSLTGIGLDRPNLVPGVDPYNASWGPQLQLLNPAAFVQNPTGTFGDVGRDVFRAPGQINFDASLSRIFAITERFNLEGRAEAFNVINHTNFKVPNTTTVQIMPIDAVTATTFGRLTSANDPRILQFALKLHF